ncbi:MAG: phosphate acetyltransferase [Lachnospiraceae bacterium]|nr:phosphate acetyltransferase [Lachnospiraceae bacterium]
MSMIEKVKEKAKADIKRIVLPEGDELRTVQAAAFIAANGYAEPILIGDPEKINAAAAETGADLTGIRIIDPETSQDAARYAEALYEIRKEKGVTAESAAQIVKDPMYFGIMMVKTGDADGLVSGAVHTTGDMLRPALQIIRTKPGMKVVSSSFIMDCPNKSLGEDGLLVYADCVVMPCPTAEELAHIAVSAAETAKTLCGIEEPKVALLSFSTKGSAKHELVTKVQKATEMAHELAPDLLLDGELQLDAALIPEIGESKAKGSPVAGHANVLIFPDLQAGNIGYKMTQRIGGAECFAVLQGLAKPCNDLSRGCSVEDIINTICFTAVQAQNS